jgi:hypothetical protein
MMDAVAANPTAGRAADEATAAEQMCSLATALLLHVTKCATTSSSISSPALSAAALQLSAVLLLLAAAEWQSRWCALTVQQQQQLLNTGPAAVDEADISDVNELLQQLGHVGTPLTRSCQLLQQQMQALCKHGQWQPQLQLLQQGGGEVLLQGLTLAVHCISADLGFRVQADLRYFRLLEVLLPRLGA